MDTKNQMKANKDKCHLLISTNESSNVNVDNNRIEKINYEKKSLV